MTLSRSVGELPVQRCCFNGATVSNHQVKSMIKLTMMMMMLMIQRMMMMMMLMIQMMMMIVIGDSAFEVEGVFHVAGGEDGLAGTDQVHNDDHDDDL